MKCVVHSCIEDTNLSQHINEIITQVPDCVFNPVDCSGDFVPTTAAVNLVLAQADLADDQDCRATLDRLEALKQRWPECIVLLIADNVGVNLDDWKWEKQFLEVGVREMLERPLNLRRLRYLFESLRLRSQQGQSDPALSHSVEADVERRIQRIAGMDNNILLTGETGVGKTYYAFQIHRQSPRADQPFVVINCANINPALAEGELFGHVKGAFTSADAEKKGLFEHAGAGTVFLDEINSLPLEVQAKLLRVVEDRRFTPVGSVRAIPLQARIVTATNACLEKLVKAGDFRSDLYYRVNGYEIAIPPIRERRQQIPALCQQFLKQFSDRNPVSATCVAPEVLDLLSQLHWEGNLRDIRNTIEYSAIECLGNQVSMDDLPFRIQQEIKRLKNSIGRLDPAEKPSDLNKMPADKAAHFLGQALHRNNQNRAKTARELGVSRMTIYNWMKRLSMD